MFDQLPTSGKAELRKPKKKAPNFRQGLCVHPVPYTRQLLNTNHFNIPNGTQ